MKEQLIQNIMQYLIDKLPEEHMGDLRLYLWYQFSECNIEKKSTEVAILEDKSYFDYMNMFLGNLLITGHSQKTCENYRTHLSLMLEKVNKPVKEITTDDLFTYLAVYKMERHVGNRYLNSKRICFNSFFKWLHKKGYIASNPAEGLDYIKYEKSIKKPYSDLERERLRCACKEERELAIIDILYSSGMRVGELVKLNREDISFENLDCVVLGKGNKEREVYLSASAAYHLQNYLKQREDENPALFVSERVPHERLRESAIRHILNKLGERAGVSKVHPHRFRRTTATNALNRGMPIQEVQTLLGHEDVNTTMMYCTVDNENVKGSHKKFLCA